jgi:iron complex transport system substrate-binding protein
VRDTLAAQGTLYTLDEALVRALAPDVILTQQLCDVCAINYGSVAAFARSLVRPPRVINLEPATLEHIFEDIRRVAAALEVPERGNAVASSLERRVADVAMRTSAVSERPSCLLLEWTDPPYCSGHWNPQLVRLAGGMDPIGREGQASRRIAWEEIAAADPDFIVVALCGFAIARAQRELAALQAHAVWQRLRAVREGRVFVQDGSAYFSRPGPRIVDSLEMLADILQPGVSDRVRSGRWQAGSASRALHARREGTTH